MDHTKQKQTIAYFSMEIGLVSGLPTYSGGLGVLAGDTIRAAADLNVPLDAMTLLHRKGYFHQRLDASGWQSEEPVEWVVEDFLARDAAAGRSHHRGAQHSLFGRWRFGLVARVCRIELSLQKSFLFCGHGR
jgi:glucan phosphorylase